MTALLVMTWFLVIVGALLYAESYRRDHPGPALAGMSVLLLSAMPALVYAGLTS